MRDLAAPAHAGTDAQRLRRGSGLRHPDHEEGPDSLRTDRPRDLLDAGGSREHGPRHGRPPGRHNDHAGWCAGGLLHEDSDSPRGGGLTNRRQVQPLPRRDEPEAHDPPGRPSFCSDPERPRGLAARGCRPGKNSRNRQHSGGRSPVYEGSGRIHRRRRRSSPISAPK